MNGVPPNLGNYIILRIPAPGVLVQTRYRITTTNPEIHLLLSGAYVGPYDTMIRGWFRGRGWERDGLSPFIMLSRSSEKVRVQAEWRELDREGGRLEQAGRESVRMEESAGEERERGCNDVAK